MRALWLTSVSSALVLTLAACNSGSSQPTAEPASTALRVGSAEPQGAAVDAVKPLSAKKFGSAITETTTHSLATIVKDPAKFDGQTVRTEGRVIAVCQAMGCWMEIADDATQAHIKMAGHSFLVPKDSKGHRAVVQGKISASPGGDTCGAKDNCREAAEKETGALAKVEIEATGVEFLD